MTCHNFPPLDLTTGYELGLTGPPNDCDLVHSGGPYSKNLALRSGTFTGIMAVNLWTAEKPNYYYTTNSCAAGKVSLHYTQVVWANSVGLGCFGVQCTNNGWLFVFAATTHGKMYRGRGTTRLPSPLEAH